MSREFYEINTKGYKARKGFEVRLFSCEHGTPSFQTGKLAESFAPYTNIDYIKNNQNILWLDFCKIDEQFGEGASHSSTIIKKRVYFGDVKKLSEVSDVEKYPTIGWYPESEELVVLSRDGKIVSPIFKNALELKNKVEVLSQQDLEEIESIEPFRSSLSCIKMIEKGSKKLIDENPDIVTSII